MFGLNEKGETCCIYVNGFNPYFYIKSSIKINERRKIRKVKNFVKKKGRDVLFDYRITAIFSALFVIFIPYYIRNSLWHVFSSSR